MLTLLTQASPVPFDIKDAAKAADIPGSEKAYAGAADAGFSIFFGDILTALLSIVGLLLLIYLIWGGIDWITSGGDASKVGNARNKITQAVIGIIVFASAFAILMIVQNAFGLDLIRIKLNDTTAKKINTDAVEKIERNSNSPLSNPPTKRRL